MQLEHPIYTKFANLAKLGCDLAVRPHHDGRMDQIHNHRQGPLSSHPHARNFPEGRFWSLAPGYPSGWRGGAMLWLSDIT